MTDIDLAKAWRFARAVDRLPERQRRIFLAASRDGKTIAEIAERMRITAVEVEHLLVGAIIRLRRDLDADRQSIRNGSICGRWTRLHRRLSARLRQGRSRS